MILKLKQLQNELYEQQMLVHKRFETKELLNFNVLDCKWKYCGDTIITFDNDGEEEFEFSTFEKYEDCECVIVREDYQQGVEDEYMILFKSKMII